MIEYIQLHPYLVFTLMTILAALYSWAEQVAKGLAPSGFVAYWLKETPAYTGGTLLAIVGAWWAVIGGDLLDGAKWQLIVASGALTGYTANNMFTAGKGAESGRPSIQGGFILPRMLLALALVAGLAVGLTACVNPTTVVQTKNQGQALTYYTIGQAYDAIDAKWERGEISTAQAKVLHKQVTLARAMLDLSREPSAQGVQDTLEQTADALASLTLNGKPAISPQVYTRVKAVLAIARDTAPGEALPEKGDTAGWLMLGSEVLRAVNAAI